MSEFAEATLNTKHGFREELCNLINRFCMETGSNTPDYVLSDFLMGVLKQFDDAVIRKNSHDGLLQKLVEAEAERESLRDQKDFCMGEIERLKQERDEAVKYELASIEAWDEERKRAIREGERVLEERAKYLAMRGLNNNATELAEKYKRERDEAREEVKKLRESFRCLLNPQCAVEEAAK